MQISTHNKATAEDFKKKSGILKGFHSYIRYFDMR